VNNFLDDLRLLYRHAGYDDSKTTFVFTDNDIKDEAFLEYINNILSSGEVANLFPKDELDEMLNNLTSNFRKKNPKGVPTWDNLYEFFINQAKNNLHLVLCFSPVRPKTMCGALLTRTADTRDANIESAFSFDDNFRRQLQIGESFRLRSLKFPGIISGCIIDWYTAWPEDALLAVSHHLLHDFPMVCTVKAKESLIKLLGDIHDDMTKDCISYYQRYTLIYPGGSRTVPNNAKCVGTKEGKNKFFQIFSPLPTPLHPPHELSVVKITTLFLPKVPASDIRDAQVVPFVCERLQDSVQKEPTGNRGDESATNIGIGEARGRFGTSGSVERGTDRKGKGNCDRDKRQ